MPRIDPLPRETLGELNSVITTVETRMGFVPNSQLILARRPEVLRAFAVIAPASRPTYLAATITRMITAVPSAIRMYVICWLVSDPAAMSC